jgi:hypothetical protein
MNRRTTRVLLIMLLCLLVLVSGAGAMSSADHAIDWRVIGGGGGVTSSSHYAIKATTGQSAIGPIGSSAHGIDAGYWYGVGRTWEVCLPLVLCNH